MGAAIALISSRVIQYWEHDFEKEKLRNFMIGCMQNELFVIRGLVPLLHQPLDDSTIKTIDPKTFSWQPNSVFIASVSYQIGMLDIQIIEQFNSYANTVAQSNAFRSSLHSLLQKDNRRTNSNKSALRKYILAIEAQIEAGEKLLNFLQ